MNYLDLVNNVLRRTRGNTVTSVSQDDHSILIGDLVNDARAQVEDAWEWNCLKTTFTVPTVAGTELYTLVDSENRITMIDAQNTTQSSWLQHWAQDMVRFKKMGDDSQSAPFAYSMEGIVATGTFRGDNQIKLFPTPDGVYSLVFNAIKREGDLSAAGDTTDLPHKPIIDLAIAMVARERGEVGGQTAAEYYAEAKRSLGVAIDRDAKQNPWDLVWEAV